MLSFKMCLAQSHAADLAFPIPWFPLGLEKRESIFQSGNFARTGRVPCCPKYWKNEKKLYWKIGGKKWKSQGNLSASNSENPANMVRYFKF